MVDSVTDDQETVAEETMPLTERPGTVNDDETCIILRESCL